jgi:hypothetical protein
MSDYIEVAPGLIINEDGEIVESNDIDDPLKFIIAQRHEANVQVKSWEARRGVLDAVILRRQADRTVDYSGVVCSLRGGSYRKTDAGKLADLLAEMPVESDDLLALVAAATAFRLDCVPPILRDAVEDCTTTHEKRPWVETSAARKLAPEARP